MAQTNTADIGEVLKARFVERPHSARVSSPIWQPIRVSRDEIDAQIKLLSEPDRPADGRHALIVHPHSEWHSLTPGIRVSIEVLLPGESASWAPTNSSSVSLCIEGGGQADVDDVTIDFALWDVFSVPNMARVDIANTGSKRQVRLVFTDEPLFEQLRARYVNAKYVRSEDGEELARDPRADFVYDLPTGGGKIKTYEGFLDPVVVEQRALLWRWPEVKRYIDGMDKDHPDLRASAIAMLWNSATGRIGGSTNSLTAFMTGIAMPGLPDSKFRMARAHRHTVTAINYGLEGSFRTVVHKSDIHWGPGDLVITAPSWGTHANGSNVEQMYTFTIQDSSLHSALNSSLLQEYMNRPPILLGAHRGFAASGEGEEFVNDTVTA